MERLADAGLPRAARAGRDHMDDTAISSRRSRRWNRVEPLDARGDRPTEAIAAEEHHLVVYEARLVRCSCGATLLATDPAALSAPVDECDDETIELHASWCEDLDLGDFVGRAESNDGIAAVTTTERARDGG
jgi:predicted short-subunit dehydrogenase-like oxidoreductase (DUF2520 family)